MQKDFSRHHIVPRSREGSNYYNNVVKLVHWVHVAFHTLFDNKTPVEQIERLLSINWTALTEDFKQDVSRILQDARSDSDYIYKNWVLRPRR